MGLDQNGMSSSWKSRSLPENHTDTLATALSEDGIEHEGIEYVDTFTLSHTKQPKRDLNEPDLANRLIARGIKADDFTHDIAFNYYGNGGLNLHVGLANESLLADPSSETTKRASNFGHAGLKISVAVFEPLELDSKDVLEFASVIAEDWRSNVVTDENMSDYIGYVMNKPKENFNFIYRIIPEISGFGLNYENTNVCGAVGLPKNCKGAGCYQ